MAMGMIRYAWILGSLLGRLHSGGIKWDSALLVNEQGGESEAESRSRGNRRAQQQINGRLGNGTDC
jgi:hypothetical protein